MIGYLLDTHFGPYDQPTPSVKQNKERLSSLRAEAHLADAVGFGAIMVPDRHARTECVVSSPLTYLAALAADVPRAHLGTFSLVLSAYHPMQVAEEAALVDLITDGRLLLTVSMGYHPDYWRQFGINPDHRKGRFEEALEVLQSAWQGERFSRAGTHFPLEDVQCCPAPTTPEGPPIWIGGESRAQRSRAAQASGWAAGIGPLDRGAWTRRTADYRAKAAELGRSSHVVLIRDAFVAETRTEALELAEEAVIAEQLFYYDQWPLKTQHPDFTSRSDFSIDRLAPHLVIGDAEDCASQLAMFRDEYDVDTVILRMRWPLGPSPEATRESIAGFGSDVLPRFEGTHLATSGLRQSMPRASA